MSGGELHTLIVPDTLRSDVFIAVFKTVITSVIRESINKNQRIFNFQVSFGWCRLTDSVYSGSTARLVALRILKHGYDGGVALVLLCLGMAMGDFPREFW